MERADVIIVGSGVAALQLARHLSEDTNVIVFTKSDVSNGNSRYAQGGIAAAIGEEDHPFAHYLDTTEAGRYANHSQTTLEMLREAPGIIQELIEEGFTCDRNQDGTIDLGREGGHHQNRIVHSGGDQTGKRLMEHLQQQIRANVEIRDHHFVYELLVENEVCYGVRYKTEYETAVLTAPHIVLSTGGCGQLYASTSNAPTITGDGFALAYEAGAEMTDMEFVQFHPTLLNVNGKTHGLVTEAVRGEGAVLVDEKGRRIMDGVHPLGDLAPRNVVANTIYTEREKGHTLYLDIRMIPQFEERFPTVTALCHRHDISLSEGFIPVTPGCHFIMGGITTDKIGRTSVTGLYAIGEAACTGVHGANRLASNSLLEGMVFSKRLAGWINEQKVSGIPYTGKNKPLLLDPICDLPPRSLLQQKMMENVGMVRDAKALKKQKGWLESFHLDQWFSFDLSLLTSKQVTTLFMLRTAWLMTVSALEREESRGGHYRSDFPNEETEWQQKQIVQEKRKSNEPIHL
ncbi:L-aspartate oxidase [Halobacillus litoralis]|uniref:L-aspartate oxidase n=1 Tax=Halobacillus litoralis TaxID=45668 RepID=UPI001CD3C79C|nr:L-aspartate oxidase [Halobacillus litoralis]MCA0972514.1 L-aspartate oxidase [Halobacillus litoralis]